MAYPTAESTATCSWPSARESLAGAVFQRLRRLVEGDVADDLDAAHQDEGEGHADGDGARAGAQATAGERPSSAPAAATSSGDGVSPAARAAASGIAAGQRGGDGERGRRPSPRVRLQAAQDRALDRGIDLAHDLRGVHGRALVVLPRDLGERPAGEGLLAR